MGIFKKFGDLSKKVAEGVTDTFISPVARELIRPAVTVRAGIDALVPGGRTGEGEKSAVNTPFGKVTPMGSFTEQASGRSFEEQGALRGGQAAGGAFEVATAGPSGTFKAAAKPFGAALGKVDDALGIGRALKESSINTYGKVLSPTTNKAKGLANKVLPQLADNKFVGTTRGLKKFVKEGIAAAKQEFNELGKMEGNVNLESINKAFEKAKSKFVIDGKIIDNLSHRILDETQQAIAQFGDSMPAESLRKLGRVWDEDVAAAGGYAGKTLDEGKKVGAQKIGADAIRDLLAKERPDFAAVNKTFSFFKRMDEILEASKLRKVGQSGFLRKAAGSMVGTIAGSAFGPTGSTVGAIAGQNIFDIGSGTLPRTINAAGKSALADALMDGKHSIPKIAEFFKRPGFAAIKTKDLINFLNKDAKLTEEEEQMEADARDARIEELRQRLQGSEETTGTPNPDREQRIEQLRQRLRGVTTQQNLP